MTKARTIANLGTGFVNISDSGTEGTKVASGTTAQRGSTQGQLRFNTTTGLAEYYTGTSFKSIDSPPTISSISPTTQAAGNSNVVITGSSFSTGVTAKFVGNDGTEYTSPSVTRNSDTQLTATTPANGLPASNEPFDIKVTNSSGLSATLADALDAGGVPAWSTAAGNLGSLLHNATGNHFTLSASDPDGTAVTYAETTSVLTSAGLALNSSTGVISGDPTDVSNSETKTFTVNANSGTDSTARTFNIIINPTRTLYLAALGAGGGGAGRESSSYTGSSDTRGAGGCGSFIEAVYEVAAGQVIYYYIGGGGDEGSASVGGADRVYGGDGMHGGTNDTSGEGGEFSGIFTANSISQANALMIAGGGGGGSGRPRGGGNGSNSGGGGIESATTGAGNHGIRGNNSGTLIGAGYGGEGGRQNSGGRAGTADSGSNNNGTAGVALIGGNGGNASSWGNGGGGGGGFFGGGGGQDDGVNWGGAGGGAGSSFIKGKITNYSTSSFNTATSGFNFQSGTFQTQTWNSSHMRVPYNYTAFGSGYSSSTNSNGSKGHGGRESSGVPGGGWDGGHGAIFYRVGNSGSYTMLTSFTGNMASFTVS